MPRALVPAAAWDVFSRAYIDTRNNTFNIAFIESPPRAVVGNAVGVQVSILASRGSFTLFAAVYSSNDGRSWSEESTTSLTGFGSAEITIASLSAKYVKVQLFLSGVDSAAIVNCQGSFVSL